MDIVFSQRKYLTQFHTAPQAQPSNYLSTDFTVGWDAEVPKFGGKYLSCAPLKVKKRKEALIL
jgi:hypothetical protein